MDPFLALKDNPFEENERCQEAERELREEERERKLREEEVNSTPRKRILTRNHLNVGDVIITTSGNIFKLTGKSSGIRNYWPPLP
jgi:hypothetical protein